MQFITYILLIIFVGGLTLLANYYRDLFADGRKEYDREEILSLSSHLIKQWTTIFSNNPISLYVGFTASLFLGYAVSFLGGIYGNSYESYFFHSAIIPGASYFALQFFRNEMVDSNSLPSMIKDNLNNITPIVLGIGLSAISQNSVVYLFYHEVNFLWILLNNVVIFGLILYNFYKSTNDEVIVPNEVENLDDIEDFE